MSTALEEELKARIKCFADIGLPLTKTVIQLLYALLKLIIGLIAMCNTMFAKL